MGRRILVALAAPLLALTMALILTCLVLLAAGDSVGGFLDTIFQAPKERNLINIMNQTSVLYLSGLAAAIGFRMNLFNIGVEGQYRLAAFAAAVFAGQAWLPGMLNVVVAVLLAMVVGAGFAAIAGILKVTRGVSEVISTIMLNAIAFAAVGYLMRKWGVVTGTSLSTKPIPEDSRVPGIAVLPAATNELYTLALLAVVAGVGYWVVLNRTRFGFDLRATGASPTAAVASGINVRRMVIASMLLSGATAGLIGLPLLFGNSYSVGTSFQTGLGFTGIAVALLGRNHPIGIAFGAVLFAFLSEQSNKLQINAQISAEVVAIAQGIVVLSVVIAYEIVRRYSSAAEQRAVAEALRTGEPGLPAATGEAVR